MILISPSADVFQRKIIIPKLTHQNICVKQIIYAQIDKEVLSM